MHEQKGGRTKGCQFGPFFLKGKLQIVISVAQGKLRATRFFSPLFSYEKKLSLRIRNRNPSND